MDPAAQKSSPELSLSASVVGCTVAVTEAAPTLYTFRFMT